MFFSLYSLLVKPMDSPFRLLRVREVVISSLQRPLLPCINRHTCPLKAKSLARGTLRKKTLQTCMVKICKTIFDTTIVYRNTCCTLLETLFFFTSTHGRGNRNKQGIFFSGTKRTKRGLFNAQVFNFLVK